MSKTKDKILAKSLKLFNEHGITDISLRMISDSLDISVGNLQYHFKKREQIIEQLYLQIVDEINLKVALGIVDTKDGQVLLSRLVSLNYHIATVFFNYRFFFMEFVAIIRNHPNIKLHYQQLSAERQQQFLAVMDRLVAQNVIHTPQQKSEFIDLYQQIETVSNFGLSAMILKKKNLNEQVIEEHAKMISHCLYPYLTQEYQDIFALLLSKKIES